MKLDVLETAMDNVDAAVAAEDVREAAMEILLIDHDGHMDATALGPWLTASP